MNEPKYRVVRLEVQLRVENVEDDDVTESDAKMAAHQAVSNALDYFYHNGFAHDLSDDLSITPLSVKVL